MPSRDEPRRTGHRPAVGFAVALACAAASLGGPQAWVDLTATTRWPWSELVLALVALLACWWVLTARHAPTRVPLVLATVSAVVVVVGELLGVFLAFHSDEDDYLSSVMWLLGNMVLASSAILGLVLAVSTRLAAQLAPPHR